MKLDLGFVWLGE